MKLFICIILIVKISLIDLYSQTNGKNVLIKDIPSKINWYNEPLDWQVLDNVFTINAGKGARLFIDPHQGIYAVTAPMALFEPDSIFLFSCKVNVDFKTLFDAGVLVIYSNKEYWAKLCLNTRPSKNRWL